MRIFKTTGMEWRIKIDAPSILAVRSAHDVDLASVSCFEQLTESPVKCQQVLWSLLSKQAAEHSVSEDVFYGLLADGDVGEDAARQLFEAIIDFFPSSQRTGLRQMLAANWEAVQAAGEMVAARVEAEAKKGSIKDKAMAEAMSKLDEIFGPLMPSGSAIDSPESSGAKSKVARSAS